MEDHRSSTMKSKLLFMTLFVVVPALAVADIVANP
jgi:hypothetical protein